jgi:hypothetical protein
MKTIKLAVLTAGLLSSLPVLAQTAGDTEDTGPQGTGNFLLGKPKGMGRRSPASRKAQETGLPAGPPTRRMR